MKKYIIQRLIKFNGKFETLYHEKLGLSTNKQAMNVYTESLGDKRKALRFYDLLEANKMAIFLEQEGISTSKILTIN